MASRFKEASDLTCKNSDEVAKAFEKIYKRAPLDWPQTLMVDPGKEFFGGFIHLMKKRNVKIQRAGAGNRISHSFVERLNREIGEKRFSRQYSQEMIMEKGTRSREFVENVSIIFKKRKNTPT